MKIVFMGSADFSIPSLKMSLEKFDVVAVVTNPDACSGRGLKRRESAIKKIAAEKNIPVLQPEKLTAALTAEIAALAPDLLVVVAYGHIIPDALLAVSSKGSINVHPSLLPKYRGAAPVPWAIINGETTTGVTIQYLASKLDCGDIIVQREYPIRGGVTCGELLDYLAVQGADCLAEAITLIDAAVAPRIVQPAGDYFYARKIVPADAKIVWTSTAQSIYNLIRGMTPKPGAYSVYESRNKPGIKVKIIKAELSDGRGAPGAVIGFDKSGITVACGAGAVKILAIQPENGKPLIAADFINGYKVSDESMFR